MEGPLKKWLVGLNCSPSFFIRDLILIWCLLCLLENFNSGIRDGCFSRPPFSLGIFILADDVGRINIYSLPYIEFLVNLSLFIIKFQNFTLFEKYFHLFWSTLDIILNRYPADTVASPGTTKFHWGLAEANPYGIHRCFYILYIYPNIYRMVKGIFYLMHMLNKCCLYPFYYG